MKRRHLALLSLAALAVVLFGGARAFASVRPAVPRGFFGIVPQTALTDQDASYMSAGGIESIRVPVPWGAIQPTANGGYNWTSLDEVVGLAARHGIRVLPFLYGTPRWLAAKPTTMPIDSAKQRNAWTAFLTAAVKRYGPAGEFWKTHEPGVVQYEPAVPELPIRTWQVWNEANFFYFAYPVSPRRYARLVQISSPAIKGVDPGAKVLLSGLFGRPTAGGARGMPAAKFLEVLYRTPGIESRFDGIALHPYAVDVETLEEIVEEVHEVTVQSHDRVPLYITEMGWGSQNDFNKVAFEQGIRGQVKELQGAYGYLLDNRRRLNLKGIDWFSWKDARGSCNFCDSVGLFRTGKRFHAKPAWHAFVALTGGRARP
jgi:Beta-galactosidase